MTADPERRSVNVETLNRAYRIVERTAHMGGCSQTHHEHLSRDAARVQDALAAIPQDATPTGLDVERLRARIETNLRHAERRPDDDFYRGKASAFRVVLSMFDPASPSFVCARPARLAATDPEADHE